MKSRIIYALMQGCYWALYCGYSGYIAFYLEDKGLPTWAIGLLTAGLGIVSAVLQPVLGRMADRERPNWKFLIFLLTGWNILMNIGLLIFTGSAVGQGFLYASMVLGLGGMLPLINAVCFALQDAGEKIDFGRPRAIGSLAAAIGSLLLGKLTVVAGPACIPTYELIMSAVTILVVALMKYVPRTVKEETKEASEKGNVFTKYPAFMIMWIGCIFFMLFHNMTNSYMIKVVENVGGDSNDLGIALAIAAVVEIPTMFLFEKIAKKFSSDKLLIFAGIMFALKGIGYFAAWNVWVIFATQILQMLSFAIFATATVFYTHETVSADDEAQGQAFMTNTMTVGTLAGNLLGGWILSIAPVRTMIVVAIAFACLGVVLCFVAGRKGKKL